MAPQLGRPATWADLPIEFRIEVAKMLDYTSRNLFRKCSKIDKFAVDDVAINLDSLTITQTPTPFWKETTYNFAVQKYAERTLTMNQVVESIESILKHRKSTIESLQIGNRRVRNTIKLTKKLLQTMSDEKEKGDMKSWKIEKLIWKGPVKNFIDFLGYLDPDYLKEVSIAGHFEISKKCMKKMVEMEQWKKLKWIKIHPSKIGLTGILHHFHHLNVARVNLMKMDAKEVANFIKLFVEYPTEKPFGSYFNIRYKDKLTAEFINEVAAYFEAEVAEGVGEIFDLFYCRRMKFKLRASQRYILSMILGENFVIGVVARPSNEELEIGQRMVSIGHEDYFINPMGEQPE